MLQGMLVPKYCNQIISSQLVNSTKELLYDDDGSDEMHDCMISGRRITSESPPEQKWILTFTGVLMAGLTQSGALRVSS